METSSRQECIRRWQKSAHGKAWQKAYAKTPRGKAARAKAYKKWLQGTKGKAWYASPQAKALQAAKSKRYRRRHPIKNAAREAVRRARKRGEIPEPSTLCCVECNAPAAQYHHHKGYARKNHLNVVPVCRPCHKKLR